MAKMVNGLVMSGDATAKFSSLSAPTGKQMNRANPAHGKGGTGTMMDPVKMANAWLRRGGK